MIKSQPRTYRARCAIATTVKTRLDARSAEFFMDVSCLQVALLRGKFIPDAWKSKGLRRSCILFGSLFDTEAAAGKAEMAAASTDLDAR